MDFRDNNDTFLTVIRNATTRDRYAKAVGSYTRLPIAIKLIKTYSPSLSLFRVIESLNQDREKQRLLRSKC